MPEPSSRPADYGRSRVAVVILAALALAVLAVALPERWYRPLPALEPLPAPPVSGWLLLRICLAVDAVVLFVLALTRRRPAPLAPHQCVRLQPDAPAPPGTFWLVAAITGGAGVLRLIALDSDLWIDEITPLLLYEHASAWQVVTSYISSNNHLLNTLLVKLSVDVFGSAEWAVRLPAVAFGVLSVPLLFWVSRQILSTRESLYAALLLAVSYHHIFFSQNARGYSAYLFFALVASGLLARGLSTDRRAVWIGYAAALTLGMASQLLSSFVIAGHAAVGGMALAHIRRQGGETRAMAARLAVVFAATALAVAHVYVVILPNAYVYMTAVYAEPAAGFRLSLELVREVTRGVSAGFGAGLVAGALLLLGLGAAGYRALWRGNWVLTAALSLPLVLQAAVLLAAGLLVSPRFFLLVLPLAILAAVAGISAVAAWIAVRAGGRPRLATGLAATAVAAVAGLSLMSLPAYYRTPKQPYRATFEHVESISGANDIIVVAHYARAGARFYTRRLGLRQDRYVEATTRDELEQVISSHPGRRVWIVSTFPRALRFNQPDLDQRIREGWTVVRTFPASIGDGQTFVWAPR